MILGGGGSEDQAGDDRTGTGGEVEVIWWTEKHWAGQDWVWTTQTATTWAPRKVRWVDFVMPQKVSQKVCSAFCWPNLSFFPFSTWAYTQYFSPFKVQFKICIHGDIYLVFRIVWHEYL